jgi:hypothetical protein
MGDGIQYFAGQNQSRQNTLKIKEKIYHFIAYFSGNQFFKVNLQPQKPY